MSYTKKKEISSLKKNMVEREKLMTKLTRIVIKVGTNVLTTDDDKIDWDYVKKLCKSIAAIKDKIKDIALVTSGAILTGATYLELKILKTMAEKQAAAAVGQALLMQNYIKYFSESNNKVAQILLTREDFASRIRHRNAKATLFELFKNNVIPIINENDTVATEEIKEMQFGDNDTLAALVANLIEAQLLIILSDVDGLYTADPRYDKSAQLIETVEEIEKVKNYAGKKGKWFSTGGMETKLNAARIAHLSNIYTIIANGKKHNVLEDVIAGKPVGTLFLKKENCRLSSRKCWLAFCLPPKGALYLDDGAINKIIHEGKSLLPKGIIKVDGKFNKDEMVIIKTEQGEEVARGLVNYNSNEINLIKGNKSEVIVKMLGYHYTDEVIHHDNLTIL